MIIGSYVKREIGKVIVVWHRNDGPRANALIIREATYEEWKKGIEEAGLEVIEPSRAEISYFYEVCVD